MQKTTVSLKPAEVEKKWIVIDAENAVVGRLASFIAMRLAEGWLALSIPARENLSLGLRAATVFVIAWAVVRWIRAMSLLLEKKLEARGNAENYTHSAFINIFKLSAERVIQDLFGNHQSEEL